MSLAITHVLYLLDHAPWLASNHKNLRACVDDTRQRLVIDHGDYDAWDKAYGLLGYSDPQTGLLIARHMSTLNAHDPRGWQYLLDAAEALHDNALAYRTARYLAQRTPTYSHQWRLARAAWQANKPRVAHAAARKALAHMQANNITPGSAVLETFAQLGLLAETRAWLYQQVLKHDDSAHWLALAHWQRITGCKGAAFSQWQYLQREQHDPAACYIRDCMQRIEYNPAH